MPIIFAQALMFVPSYIGRLNTTSTGQWIQTNSSDIWTLVQYFICYFSYYITYFYTAITVPTNKMSDDLKRVVV